MTDCVFTRTHTKDGQHTYRCPACKREHVSYNPPEKIHRNCQAAKRQCGSGPGTRLKKLLAFFRWRVKLGCGCGDKIRLMDAMGRDWCWEHRAEILDWLAESAKKESRHFWRPGAWVLLWAACWDHSSRHSQSSGQG